MGKKVLYFITSEDITGVELAMEHTDEDDVTILLRNLYKILYSTLKKCQVFCIAIPNQFMYTVHVIAGPGIEPGYAGL